MIYGQVTGYILLNLKGVHSVNFIIGAINSQGLSVNI